MKSAMREWWVLAAIWAIAVAIAVDYAFDHKPARWARQEMAGKSSAAHDSVYATLVGGECLMHDNNTPRRPVAQAIGDIPEFHDCQRFIEGTSAKPKYSAPYAIFAAENLNDLWPTTPAGDLGKAGFVVAQIYSWGGQYEELGIHKGYNCLFLFGTPEAPRATMVSYGPSPKEDDCRKDNAAKEKSAEKQLLVKRTSSDLGGENYPPAARWEWDAMHWQQYIGVKCGAGWCEVYDPSTGLQSAETYPMAGEANVANRRVREIKGWFDEQLLAVVTHDTGGVRVSAIRGVLVPDPDLGSATFSPGEWVPVANVSLYGGLDADVAFYEAKLNFTRGLVVPTPPGLGLRPAVLWASSIALCKGDRLKCGVPDTLQCSESSERWARITRTVALGRTSPMYRCVTRRPHEGLKSPGLVRWRWTPADETVWVSCDEGCCEVRPS